MQRQKHLNVFLFELDGRLLFVPGLGLHGKPLPGARCLRRLE
jgi:hypothetical protein